MSRYGRRPEPAADRFWRYVEQGDGCWEWRGGKSYGYGSFRLNEPRRVMAAHRWAWEAVKRSDPSWPLRLPPLR